MRRRANGEGSIFQRKNKRWEAHISVKQINGLPKRVCVSGKSRALVVQKLKAIQQQEEQGVLYSGKEWTVGEYLDYWIVEVQTDKIRETTMSTYKRMIRIHIKPTIGYHKLKTLSVPQVRRALNELRKRGCSEAIIQKYLIMLTACLNCAMREELITRNVAKLVERPEYTPKDTVVWTLKQAMHFLQTAKKHPLCIAFLLLLTYGLRRGEVLGLRYSDIDFDNGLIYVRQQIDRIDGVIMARELKTKNSRRILPLVPIVRAMILAVAKRNGIAIPPFNPNFELSTTGTIVTSGAGTPVEPRNLARCFHLLTKKAGLPRIKLHALRHTTATILKDLNVPIKDVQLILGHANISTTLSIYQHGTPENQLAAMSTVGQRLLPDKTAFAIPVRFI